MPNIIDGTYESETPVDGATEEAIDLVKVATSQTPVTSDRGHVDGFDLSKTGDDTASVTLTLTVAVVEGIEHAGHPLLRALHDAIEETDKFLKVLRNRSSQILAGDLVDTTVDVSVTINDIIRTCRIFAENADISARANDGFVCLEHIGVSSFTTSTVATAYTGRSIADLGDSVTLDRIDFVKITSALPREPVAGHLVNVDGFDLSGASGAVSLRIDAALLGLWSPAPAALRGVQPNYRKKMTRSWLLGATKPTKDY